MWYIPYGLFSWMFGAIFQEVGVSNYKDNYISWLKPIQKY